MTATTEVTKTYDACSQQRNRLPKTWHDKTIDRHLPLIFETKVSQPFLHMVLSLHLSGENCIDNIWGVQLYPGSGSHWNLYKD